MHKLWIAILIIAFGFLVINNFSLYEKYKTYEEKQSKIENKIEEEQERAAYIDEYENYVYSDEFVKDTARTKLGMAYENEIIFKIEGENNEENEKANK